MGGSAGWLARVGLASLRSVRAWLAVLAVLVLEACGGAAPPARQAGQPTSAPPAVRYANIGGYLLAYECAGTGSPTVLLEAGYTASGISTYGPVIVPALARRTRVCTYDRAGDGLSDARPAKVRPLTGATQARELRTLLKVIGAGPPYVLVGHSYGGMITREFAGLYPHQVVGMVLLDASSEPEVAIYDRLHAGPWIDDTVQPAPNQKINIHATVRQLERAPSLGRMPLIVITASILQDQWLKTVPELEARAQTRLAMLSADSIHVLDRGIGHLIPTLDPRIVIVATKAVLAAAATRRPLAPCPQVFRSVPTAECLRRGQLAR
jgi:pimeloyl-ACP methyl ester carboxylesterase